MAKRKVQAGKEPYVENYPPLHDWLNKVNAYCLWQKIDKNMSVEGWFAGNQMFIIQVLSDNCGWNIFTPCSSGDIIDTLVDAEKRLNI